MSDDGWNPGAKYQFYLQKISEVLDGGGRRTVRDVYYALEARGMPKQCAERGWEFKYDYVKRAVKLGRRNGYIDPSMIFDASRPTEVEPDEGYDDPESFVDDVVDGVWEFYGEDFWRDQPKHVEVWLEKQSLADVFQPICDDHNVRLEATRGDWSDSKVYETAQRLIDHLNDGDDIKVLYFGDFNPSGLHAPCAVQETMGHYGMPFPFRGNDDDGVAEHRYFNVWPRPSPLAYSNAPGSIEFERIALNLEHIERYDLPENPTPSSTDKDKELRERFMTFASEQRDVNIELNALKEYHRDDLEEMLEDAITNHIDEEQREETEARIERRKEQIEQAVDVDKEAL